MVRPWIEGGGVPSELSESPAAFLKCGFRKDLFDKLSRLYSSDWSDAEMERCAEMGVSLIFMGDGGYPQQLMGLKSPPLALYVRGSMGVPLDMGSAVSVVGTRRASRYGLEVAKALGERLGQAGLWTLSGGAAGVDRWAHLGAISAGGPTCAVLGTGVDVVFPASHGELFARISQSGCLISEYPLGTKGAQWRFPQRNRIIAALSGRLVVVEAPKRSGALLTAAFAAQLGRDVWAVPGRIGDQVCQGSNMLIYDGAMALVDLDLITGVGLSFRELREDGSEKLDRLGQSILDLLAQKGDRTVDNLALECKIGAADLLCRLAILEASGMVYRSSPGRFSLSPRVRR